MTTMTWLDGITQDFRAPIDAKVFGPYTDGTWDVELYIGTDVMATVTFDTLDNLLENMQPVIADAKANYIY